MCLTSCDPYLDDIFGEWSRPTGNNGNTKTTVAVKSVTLDQTTLTKAVGDDAVTLTATVDPSDASDKTVTWKSSDASIAAVDANGKVTFVASGTTTITATATNGTEDTADDKTAECAVTVNAAAVPVTSVTLDKAVLRIDKYTTTETLKATVSPAEATDKTVTWKSSDESVATVDASGKITPIKAGTVTIKATAGDKTATSTVYVYDEIYAISDMDLEKNALAGKSYLFTSNGTPLGTKIIIHDGATVTLNGINITKQIECAGDATIILADGSTNTVTASEDAGIQIGGTGTLTINAETEGTGTLTAKGGSSAAGIGTRINGTGGNIVINGGTVTATGGDGAAGIGTGEAYYSQSTCGDITIIGGTVIATGGKYGAGIGTGYARESTNTCGAITIVTGVTSVTATKGTDSPNSIGKGGLYSSGTQNCGTIIFGTAAVFNGSAWSPDPMAAGTYGGLSLAISGNTWTLTPAE